MTRLLAAKNNAIVKCQAHVRRPLMTRSTNMEHMEPVHCQDTTSSTHPAHFSRLAGQKTRFRVPCFQRVKMSALTKMLTLDCLVPQARDSCLADAAAFSSPLFSFFVSTMRDRNILKPSSLELHGECCFSHRPFVEDR